LTIESIAKEAGVGKPTIYRWWPNKAAVVIDAFFDTMSPHMDYPQGGTVADSLKPQLHQVLRLTRGKQGRLMAEIIAEGQSDPDVLESFRKRFLEIRRAAARELIRRGQATGEISPLLRIAHAPLNTELVGYLIVEIAETCVVADLLIVVEVVRIEVRPWSCGIKGVA